MNSQTGRSVTHIDVAACTARGVVVAAGSGSPYATAELTWGLVLAAARRIPQEAAQLKAGRWQTSLGVGLRGRTLGVFGFGNIGTVVAGYGRAFGMRVLVWGRDSTLAKAAAAGYETARNQGEFFARSDFLTLHLRYSSDRIWATWSRTATNCISARRSTRCWPSPRAGRCRR